MEMYLGEIPIYTIMLIGRWSSDDFLRYIRKQVEQFLRNAAKKMLTFRSFRHIPDIAPRQISSEDPRQRIHRNNAKTISPCTPNQRTGQHNTINGGASISDRRRRRRGIVEGEERGELKINLSIPNPNHQCTSCALLCLIAVRRGGWLRSCFVDWTQTEEQVSGKAGAKILLSI
jgi:hypothetical protein